MRKDDIILLVYLLKCWCAVEMRRDNRPCAVPPSHFSAMRLSDGRSYAQHQEEWAALGARAMTEMDMQTEPAACWLPALLPGRD